MKGETRSLHLSIFNPSQAVKVEVPEGLEVGERSSEGFGLAGLARASNRLVSIVGMRLATF